jgi:4-hydroxyphenylpyruvate dioxygenase
LHASYACQSGDVRMVFTAPYRSKLADKSLKPAIPGFSPELATDFFTTHGLGVKAVAVEVDNVAEAFTVLTSNGAAGVLTPRTVTDSKGRGSVDFGEVSLYGDVVLRLIDSKKFSGSFLPDFEDVTNPSIPDYGRGRFGLKRIDHVVGNLHELPGTLKKLKQMTGFHEFAEFISEDVGTVDSGLNRFVFYIVKSFY